MDNHLETGDLVSFKDVQKSEDSLGVVYGLASSSIMILPITPNTIANQNTVHVSIGDLSDGSIPKDYLISTDYILSIEKNHILEKIGRLSTQKIDELLRKMIFNITNLHYDLIHKKSQKFVPGKTYVPYSAKVYDADEMTTLMDSSLDFWLTSGRYAKKFERDFANFLGATYCSLTNSGSSANLLAVSALTSIKLGERRLSPGDEVITTACAFPTTVNPIIQNNLIPVFLDVDLDGTYNIESKKIEAAISPKTKAIFLAHTLGNPFNIDKILPIVKKYDLWLIEDNCDAVGSKYNNRFTGTFGDISTYSFYPPHHLTMGEGGALLTDDALLKRIIESFRDWGRDCWCDPGIDNTCKKRFDWQLGKLPFGYDHKYIYSHIGYNLKITDLQASIGVAQLKKLPRFIEARKKNWEFLYKKLKKYENYFILPKAMENSEPSWFGFLLTVRENAPFTRNEITKHLEDNKIATRLLFSGNIVRHPSLENAKYRIVGNLANTDFIMENSFWIGVYPGLTEDMLNHMVNVIVDFIEMKKGT